jgi:hypothetical protein
METTGFYNTGGSGGIGFIDPAKLVAGQRKSPNVFILKETTAIAIDNIPINTPAGQLVVNVNGFWSISGSEQVKKVIDVSGGNLPNTGVLQNDIYLVNVGGTVNGIVLVSGDKIQAKIDNPTQNQTAGVFDEWTLIKAPNVSSISILRPNNDSVETTFVKITHLEFGLVAPQSSFTINHNKNAYITSIKFSKNGDSESNGIINNYTENDLNTVSFSTNSPLPTGAKIKIQFNL